MATCDPHRGGRRRSTPPLDLVYAGPPSLPHPSWRSGPREASVSPAMEAVAVAASAAAAAAKEEALATSAAAAAAIKDAEAAAATAREARAAAEEAAATASGAELTAKEAAVKASAAVLNAKEAAGVAAALEEAAAAATATVQTSRKRKFHLIDGQDSPGIGDDNDAGSMDFISRLPDAVLGTIVSLLPTKEGARTQAVSRRWRPLWRSAPLNLMADSEFKSKGHKTIDLVPKILAEHPGPGRHFSLVVSTSDCCHKVKGWLSSQALDNLQELELTYYEPWRYKKNQRLLLLLPSSAYRFAPTLRVAKFSGCHFPDSIVQLSLEFPCLKQLTLDSVTTSEGALQGMLSGCLALESLELKKNIGFGHLCISSQTVKSIGFSSGWKSENVLVQTLIIKDAPSLERLLPLDPHGGLATIKVISAPKLKIFGVLSVGIGHFQFGTTIFQEMFVVSLTTKMHTVKVLVLDTGVDTVEPNLDKFLKCFPCLERLYVTWQRSLDVDFVRAYDPLDPIECIELHLKKVVLKNYHGTWRSSIGFANFFILNAKVLKEMNITLTCHRQPKWFANQYSLLRIENRASRDALIELTCGTKDHFAQNRDTHDLSMADPFDMPTSRCSKCS